MCCWQTSAITKGNLNVKEEHFWTKIALFHDCIQQVFCICRKLKGVFWNKIHRFDFMCFEKPFPSRRSYKLRWWKELMACVNRNGVICKIKQAFSEVNSWIKYFLPGLLLKIFEFFTYLSPAASCMQYYDINLLQFSQIEFELSAK